MNDYLLFCLCTASWFCGFVFGWIAAKDYFKTYPKELNDKIQKEVKQNGKVK